MPLIVLAWAATFCILYTYAQGVRSPNRMQRFHWANAVGCVPLIALNLLAGVYPQVVISAAFGLIAWCALLRKYARSRTERYKRMVRDARFREQVRDELDALWDYPPARHLAKAPGAWKAPSA